MTDTGPVTKRDLVEGNFDKVVSAERRGTALDEYGGTIFRTMGDVIDGAKMMSMSGPLLPKWLQANPGGCWGVIVQVMDWNKGRPPDKQISPIFAARMSFEVNNQVGYMAQMFTALINTSGLFKQRPRYRYEGEGQERKCCVTLHFRDEVDPIEHWTPILKEIKPQNSPLWKSDPDQQQAYYAIRTFGRKYCPEVLAGFYDADDELPSMPTPSDRARDVTPTLSERLGGNNGEGFRPGHVENTLSGTMGPADELDMVAAEPGDVSAPIVAAEEPVQEKVTEPQATQEPAETAPVAEATSEPAAQETAPVVTETKPKTTKKTKAEPEAKSDPKPEPKEDTIPTPKTDIEYEAWSTGPTGWMTLAVDDAFIEARWLEEKGLRTKCSVVGEVFSRIKKYRDDRIAVLQGRT